MTTESQEEKSVSIIPMLQTDFIGVVALGAIAGFLMWMFGGLLNRFVFDPYLCQNAIGDQCVSAVNYAAILSGLFVGAISLVGLIRLRVYRPLLVVLASFMALWGVVQLTWGMSTLTGILVIALLYGIAFGVFTWIARLREFWISLILTILLVVVVRLVLSS